jgi:DNA-binding SARP family transcriptional activator
LKIRARACIIRSAEEPLLQTRATTSAAAAPNGTAAAARVGPAGVRVTLLGGFSVACGEEEVELPLSAQRLVAFLALQDVPLLRLYVAGVLWPDTSEKRSYANLRSALWRVRRAPCEIVEAKGANLRLAPEASVDVRDAVRTATRFLDGDASPVSPAAVRSLSTDLLPDCYEDWVVGERERLRQMRLHALEALAERLTEHGDFAVSAEASLTALRDDPLRETAHRALIRNYLAEGNSAEAVRHYRSYRGLLGSRLGLEPSARIKELFDSLPTISL